MQHADWSTGGFGPPTSIGWAASQGARKRPQSGPRVVIGRFTWASAIARRLSSPPTASSIALRSFWSWPGRNRPPRVVSPQPQQHSRSDIEPSRWSGLSMVLRPTWRKVSSRRRVPRPVSGANGRFGPFILFLPLRCYVPHPLLQEQSHLVGGELEPLPVRDSFGRHGILGAAGVNARDPEVIASRVELTAVICR